MRVDEKLDFQKYLSDTRFSGRDDHTDWGHGNKSALVSQHYFYFGKNAISSNTLPSTLPIQRLFKKGPGFRRDFPAASLNTLINWFERTFKIGMHGDPCTAKSDTLQLKLRPAMRCHQRAITQAIERKL
jgi:hypothetical protein